MSLNDKVSASFNSTLQQLSDVLLFSNETEALLRSAQQLHDLFAEITGISGYDPANSYDATSYLPNGKALSPPEAALCVVDFARTSKFLRGVNAAICEAQNRFPFPLHVVYAGCGPFATLFTPLAHRFQPNEVQFTLLEVHDKSLEAAKRLIQTLGLQAYVREYLLTDAASFKALVPFHVVVVEAIQTALQKETQLGITLNLAPQLSPYGIFIPEDITIAAYLFDRNKEFTSLPSGPDEPTHGATRVSSDRVRIDLGTLLKVDRDIRKPFSNGESLEPVVLSIPRESSATLSLMLTTTIRVFADEVLNVYDAGITAPLVLDDRFWRGANKIEFTYAYGSEPGFKYRLID